MKAEVFIFIIFGPDLFVANECSNIYIYIVVYISECTFSTSIKSEKTCRTRFVALFFFYLSTVREFCVAPGSLCKFGVSSTASGAPS